MKVFVKIISMQFIICLFGSMEIYSAATFKIAGLSGDQSFDAAMNCYDELTADPENPFALSAGVSLSQTKQTNNTVNWNFIRSKMHSYLKKLTPDKAVAWLSDKDRYWYALRSLPKYTCANGHEVDTWTLKDHVDKDMITTILRDVASNRHGEGLALQTCPHVGCRAHVTEKAREVQEFTQAHKDALLVQLNALCVDRQSSLLPNTRLSIEIADILKNDSTEIDYFALLGLSNFIRRLGNPLLVFHHYANPLSRPNLFEEASHVDWFAHVCCEIVKMCPLVTHVCPVSQPVGFTFRVERQTLPPFGMQVDRATYLDNITKAQVAAARKMKEVRPNLKVLISHQWKVMKPLHTSKLDPRYMFELGITKIADMLYNQKFVNLVKPYIDEFDGIALSVYPALKFNGTKPSGDNTMGVIDFEGSLDAVVQTNKAFPGKDIYIVEAGCNTPDPLLKVQYIDMMMNVCKFARRLGIPVKGLYLWGITNDPNFYTEWNTAPGSTHFGPFDRLDVEDPAESMNVSGHVIRQILGRLPIKSY